jgi:hypothetical protein
MQNLDQAIRERAYHLWIESGCADGNSDAHWLAAQREILSASLAGMGGAGDSKPAKSAKRKKAAGPRKRKAA